MKSVPSATVWSPATAPSTAAVSASSARTSRCSAAASARCYGEKIVKVQDLAIKTGRPIIGINDGAGARIQEGVVSLGVYSRIVYNNILASGRHPADLPDHGRRRRQTRLPPDSPTSW
jgi:hypothetical protein